MYALYTYARVYAEIQGLNFSAPSSISLLLLSMHYVAYAVPHVIVIIMSYLYQSECNKWSYCLCL